MKNKKIIILLSGLLILVIVLVVWLIVRQSNVLNNSLDSQTVFSPEFMTADEKIKLGIPLEENIQIITRDENNSVSVYKVLDQNETAIDPNQIEPLSPRRLLVE